MRKFLLYFSLALIASLVTQRFQYPQEAFFQAWFLDVGQGNSVLVKSPSNHYLLYDGGPGPEVLHQLGEVLPPQHRTIDAIVLSHPHADHVRGLIAVLERYTVHAVWSSGSDYQSGDFTAWQKIIAAKNIPTRFLNAPQILHFHELLVQVIHPTSPMVGKIPTETHDGNLALRVSYNLQSILLIGDVAEKQERQMIYACKPPSCSLDSDVLQVAHHGSASGTNTIFLNATSPQAAVIPVGAKNKFKHPRPEVLERLKQNNIYTLRTDEDGRVMVHFLREGVEIMSTAGKKMLIPFQSLKPAPT